MDTTHMVTKRIEQALTQLQRELRREGVSLPYETFTVTTGESITVEAASRPVTVPVQSSKQVIEDVKEAIEQRMTPAELRRSKKSEPSEDVPAG